MKKQKNEEKVTMELNRYEADFVNALRNSTIRLIFIILMAAWVVNSCYIVGEALGKSLHQILC